MSIFERKIGKRISEVRLEQKLTQAQLAEKMGMSVESISRMERGVTFPSLKTMESMSESLGVPLKRFFEFEDEDSRSDSDSRELAKLVAMLKDMDEGEVVLLRKILKEIADWKERKE